MREFIPNMKNQEQIQVQINRLQCAKLKHDSNPPGFFAPRKEKIKHAHLSALFDNDIKTLQWVLRDYLPNSDASLLTVPETILLH